MKHARSTALKRETDGGRPEAGGAVYLMPSTSGISLGIANVASWKLRLTLLSLSNFTSSAWARVRHQAGEPRHRVARLLLMGWGRRRERRKKRWKGERKKESRHLTWPSCILNTLISAISKTPPPTNHNLFPTSSLANVTSGYMMT